MSAPDVIDVEEDTELWEELTAPTFEDDNKVVKVEPKDDIKKRLGRSPDKADAFVMGNWVRLRHVGAVRPGERVLRENQSPGFNYDKQQPRERESGEQYADRMLRAGYCDPLYRRTKRPYARGPVMPGRGDTKLSDL